MMPLPPLTFVFAGGGLVAAQRKGLMMNHTDGWMNGWMGGGMWLWTVIGVLVVSSCWSSRSTSCPGNSRAFTTRL